MKGGGDSMEKLEQIPRVVSVPCYNFIDKDGFRKVVTAIIVPIGFEKKNGKIIISWGCSCALACQSQICRYSKVGCGHEEDWERGNRGSY